MSDIIRRDDNLIVFQANGEGFSNTFDLHAVERLLPEYRRLLDVSFRYTTNQNPTRSRGRIVEYRSQFEPGCLDVIVDIALKASPVAAGLLAADGGGYQLAKSSFLLISKILELRKKVKEFLDKKKALPSFQMNMQHATLTDSLLAPIVVNGNNNTISVTPTVYLATHSSIGAVNRLARAVDGKIIHDVNLQHQGLMGEKLTISDRNLADATMGNSEQTVKIQGRLDALNISSQTGKLITGEAHYPVKWDRTVKEKLKTVLDRESVIFTVRPISDFSRLSDAPVSFYILDCVLGQLEF